DRNWDLLILCGHNNVVSARDLARRLGDRAEVKVIPREYSLLERSFCKVGRLLGGNDTPFDRWYRSLGVDLLHVPYACAPPGRPPCPWIFTMHDVQELHFPEFFS